MSNYTAANFAVEAANGTSYAYRRFGNANDRPPVLFLMHFRGNLDNWDPALVDDIANDHEVILFDNSGVGLSTGVTPDSVGGLARDTFAFLDALNITRVDLMGFSTGGFVAQEMTLLRPGLVNRLILAGTAPKGGRGFHEWSPEVRAHAYKDVQGADDIHFLFFPQTEASQSRAEEFVQRIFTRTEDRDRTPALTVRDAQGQALAEWGIPDHSQLARLGAITVPTLVANGDNDIMIPTENSYLLAGHLPHAELILYPDSGHGFLFEHPKEFAADMHRFLDTQ